MRSWSGIAAIVGIVLVADGASAQSVDTRMSGPRLEHAAVTLDDGRVLVAGGAPAEDEGALASAEVFESGRWRTVAPLQSPRVGATLTLLADGRVLAIGGHDGAASHATAELWDPVTERWSLAAQMCPTDARSCSGMADRRRTPPTRATRAPRSGARETGTWTDAGRAGEAQWPRFGSVVALPDGRVVVAGGQRWEFPSAAAAQRAYAEACEGVHVPELSVRDVFVWDAARGWSRGPSLRHPRVHAAGALVADDTIVITGGEHVHYGRADPPTPRRSIDVVSLPRPAARRR